MFPKKMPKRVMIFFRKWFSGLFKHFLCFKFKLFISIHNSLVQLIKIDQMSLHIRPISALLTHDTEMFSNMDPYVIIKINDETKRTRTHKEGGKKPRWSDSFTFQVYNPQMMEIIVMDQDRITDDLVGSAKVDLKQYTSNPGEYKQYISLTYKKRSAGKIYMEIKYETAQNFRKPNNQYPNQGVQKINHNNEWISQQQNQYQNSYQQPPVRNQPPPSTNWGFNPSSNNSGWGQSPPQPIGNQQANLAQKLLGAMNPPPPPPPQPDQNVLGILGNLLKNNMDSTESSNPYQQNPYGTDNNRWGDQKAGQNNNNSGWESDQSWGSNNGWGPNNNGWGNNNGRNNNGW